MDNFLKEESEAIKEVAKTSGKAIDLMAKLAGFFKMVFRETAVELGGVTNDWAKYFRYKNLIPIQEKVNGVRLMNGVRLK